jgi:hypothetical protein
MQLHLGYCKGFGIPREAIESAEEKEGESRHGRPSHEETETLTAVPSPLPFASLHGVHQVTKPPKATSHRPHALTI